jgi:release factor glutamine methyltransferase
MTALTEPPPALLSCRIDGLELSWDDRVLQPRPWTRAQARWATELAPELPPGPLLELCCGVGHIGLLAVRDTGRPGVLVDADGVACGHARRNAARAGLASTVRILRHRLDGNAVPHLHGRVPLVLADPPYLPTAEVGAWPPDPLSAIDGGEDGLDLVALVLRTAAAHLLPGGVCLLQVRGPRQAAAVSSRLERAWADIPLAPTAVRAIDADRAIQMLRPRR